MVRGVMPRFYPGKTPGVFLKLGILWPRDFRRGSKNLPGNFFLGWVVGGVGPLSRHQRRFRGVCYVKIGYLHGVLCLRCYYVELKLEKLGWGGVLKVCI